MTHSNISLLEQGIRVIRGLDTELFAKPEVHVCAGGVGAQLRHCLDFYGCFLAGLEARKVDYDARERDEQTETVRDHALARLEEVVDALRAVSEQGRGLDADEPLQVKMDGDEGSVDRPRWSRSSVGRELQFLLSHTIHHYAIIAVILRLNGVDPGPDFGFAPSTLAYQKASVPCAP